MAVKYAVASGNWSNPATWNGGVKPSTGDSVHANGYSVSIDEDVNLGSSGMISNRANSPAIDGGSFSVVGTTRNITSNLQAGGTNCLLISIAFSNIHITGNLEGGNSTSGSNCLMLSSTNSTIQITGNLQGGSVGSDNSAVNMGAAGTTLTLMGNASGGSGVWATGVFCTAGTVNVIGNLYGGTGGFNACGVATYSTGVSFANIVGNVYGSLSGSGSGAVAYAGSYTITGNCYGRNFESLTSYTAIVVINGDVHADVGAGINVGGGSITINGTIYPSIPNYGAVLSSPTYVYIRKVIGAPTDNFRPTVYNYPGTIPAIVEEVVMGVTGLWPFFGPCRFLSTASFKVNILLSDDSRLTLTPSGADQPSEEDVRNGTQYDSGNKTGTLKVPPPSSVISGVPTDDTVGTASTDGPTLAEAILEAINSSSNPLAQRLKNVSTVETTGAQIASLK